MHLEIILSRGEDAARSTSGIIWRICSSGFGVVVVMIVFIFGRDGPATDSKKNSSGKHAATSCCCVCV